MKTNYFSDNLRFLRKLNKITQFELAAALNISRATISAWEKQTRNPIVADVVRVCEYFNIPIEQMLGKDLSLDKDKTTAIYNHHELISLFNQLNLEQQDKVLETIKSMLQG